MRRIIVVIHSKFRTQHVTLPFLRFAVYFVCVWGEV